MTQPKKKNPFIELIITIVLPSIILMKLSGADKLGTAGALVLALAFPLTWGLIDLVRQRKINYFAVLGLISVLLTGGIGLLKLDAQWLAVKEAAIPGIIGLVVLISVWTNRPLIRLLVYNPTVVNVERIQHALALKQSEPAFESSLRRATMLLAGTFFFSSFMNYVLAKWVVQSPSGTEAFNEELGRMTLLSYPVIAIPSMIMMIAVFFYLINSARKLTGLDLSEMLHQGPEDQKN